MSGEELHRAKTKARRMQEEIEDHELPAPQDMEQVIGSSAKSAGAPPRSAPGIGQIKTEAGGRIGNIKSEAGLPPPPPPPSGPASRPPPSGPAFAKSSHMPPQA